MPSSSTHSTADAYKDVSLQYWLKFLAKYLLKFQILFNYSQRKSNTSSVAPIALDAATAMAALLPEPTCPNNHIHYLSNYLFLSILTDIFPGEPGLASYIGAKDDGSGGDNWSCKTCKVPVKSSPPTNQHPTFYRPDALPVAQPTASEHWYKSFNTESTIFHTISLWLTILFSFALCGGGGLVSGTPELRALLIVWPNVQP